MEKVKDRREYFRLYNATHRQQINEYHRKYRASHPEFESHRRRYNREWIINNRDRYNASKWKYRDELKSKAIAFYSNGASACVWCGFKDLDALCLDHINDDGAADRKRRKIAGRGNTVSGSRTYEALYKAGFPPGYQVLCANCNMIKEVRRRRSNRGKGVIDASKSTDYHHSLQLFAQAIPTAILGRDGERL